MTRLVLDVDTGTDDAIALMLAALEPRLELIAVTTVAGNASVEHTTENTLRVLDLVGCSAPVYRGAASALLPSAARAGQAARSRAIHGEYLDLPVARSRAEPTPAAEFLVGAFADGADVVVVATGPLSNVATALLLDPGLAGRIPRLVMMGGGHARANITAAAEFNVWADPEAARIVLSSGIHELTVVPLDATHQALVSEDDCERLAALDTAAAVAAARIIRGRIDGYARVAPPTERRAAPVHDAVCVAYLADPDVLELRQAHVDVELAGELTRGRTVVDFRPIPEQEPNARWALAADRERFLALLLGAFAPSGRAS